LWHDQHASVLASKLLSLSKLIIDCCLRFNWQALAKQDQSTCDQKASVLVGKLLAEKAKAANVDEVHFSNHRQLRYQGKLRALIESLRSHGLRVK
jgi:hypothetical protein